MNLAVAAIVPSCSEVRHPITQQPNLLKKGADEVPAFPLLTSGKNDSTGPLGSAHEHWRLLRNGEDRGAHCREMNGRRRRPGRTAARPIYAALPALPGRLPRRAHWVRRARRRNSGRVATAADALADTRPSLLSPAAGGGPIRWPAVGPPVMTAVPPRPAGDQDRAAAGPARSYLRACLGTPRRLCWRM